MKTAPSSPKPPKPTQDVRPHGPKAPVTYFPDFVENPDELLRALQVGVQWERRTTGEKGTVPRSEFYCNDHPVPYTYGGERNARTYQPNPLPDVIKPVRAKLARVLTLDPAKPVVLDVCFLNRYLDAQDSLQWHSDDSPEMDDASPIVTVSLGAVREIWFRALFDVSTLPKGSQHPFKEERLLLGNGSAAVMAPGMQDTHEHRIPRCDRQVGERISLTFRHYVQPKS